MFLIQCPDFNSLGIAIDFSSDQRRVEMPGTVLGADTVDSVALFVGVRSFEFEILLNCKLLARVVEVFHGGELFASGEGTFRGRHDA
jgi:hypothetical protein